MRSPGGPAGVSLCGGVTRSVAVFSVVVGLGLFVGACGGGGGKQVGVAHIGTTTTVSTVAGAPVGATPASPGQVLAELEKFVSCMRSHGISQFPDPAISSHTIKIVLTPSLTGSPQFAAAARACRQYAPAGPTSEGITPAEQVDYLNAAACMRSHGIVGFPDPKFTNGNVTWPIPPGMGTSSVPFRKARETCEMLIPEGLPYSKEAEGGQ